MTKANEDRLMPFYLSDAEGGAITFNSGSVTSLTLENLRKAKEIIDRIPRVKMPFIYFSKWLTGNEMYTGKLVDAGMSGLCNKFNPSIHQGIIAPQHLESMVRDSVQQATEDMSFGFKIAEFADDV